MRTKYNIVITLLVCLLTTSAMGNQLRTSQTAGPGDIYAYEQICQTQIFKDAQLNPQKITANGDAYEKGGVIFLTEAGKKNAASSVFWNTPIDVETGFVSTFQLNVERKTCYGSKQIRTGSKSQPFKKSKCGGEGMAFVIQPNSPKALGYSGSGLGYAGIENALAIEFDMRVNSEVNDPDVPEQRHISIIAKKGTADAQEVNVIGWNDAPFNFNGPEYENFMRNPKIEIRYIKGKLVIYLNEIVQAKVDVDIPKLFGMSTNEFFVGFTASTGELTQDLNIKDWTVGLIQPSPLNSFGGVFSSAELKPLKAGDQFKVFIELRDGCNNPYESEDFSKITFDFGLPVNSFPNCAVTREMRRNKKNAAQMIVGITCYVAKPGFRNTITVKWDGQPLKQMPIFVDQLQPADIEYAYVECDDYVDEKAADKDKVCKATANELTTYTIIPVDVLGNHAVISDKKKKSFLASFSLQYPAKGASNPPKIEEKEDGTFKASFTSANPGNYKIVSKKYFLKRKAQDYTYKIYMEYADPDPKTSFCLLSLNKDTLEPLGKNSKVTVTAGQTNVFAGYRFKDASENDIPFGEIDWQTNGVALRLETFNETQQKVRQYSFDTSVSNSKTKVIQAPLKVAGKNKFYCAINSVEEGPININGVVTVQPGALVWDNTAIWQYDYKVKDLKDSKASDRFVPWEIVLFSQREFGLKLMMVLKDEFFNIHPWYMDTQNYQNRFTMQMTGHNMQAMDLCLKWNDYTQKGFVFQVCEGKGREFRHLVGRDNYTLTLTDTKAQPQAVSKKINLDLYGLPDDHKYGNGPYVPEKTKCELRSAYPQHPKFDSINKIHVGDWGEMYCTLYTAEDLIYYDYVKSEDIELVFANGHASNQYKIRTDFYGKFWVKFRSAKMDLNHQLSVKVKGNTQAQNQFIVRFFWQQPLKAMIIPDAFENPQDSSNKPALKNTPADQELILYIQFWDGFGNPAFFFNTRQLRRNGPRRHIFGSGENIANKPGIKIHPRQCFHTKTIGVYGCKFIFRRAGDYQIKSYLFKNHGTEMYTWKVIPGQPSTKFSFATFTQKTLVGDFQAGNTKAKFAVKLFDKYHNLITPNVFENLLGGELQKTVQVSLYEPENKTPFNMNERSDLTQDQYSLDKSGKRYLYNFVINKAGVNTMQVSLNGKPVRCPMCQKTVSQGPIDFSSSKVYMMQKNKWVQVSKTETFTIENTKINPMFKLVLCDQGGNQFESITTDIKSWETKIMYTDGQNSQNDVVVVFDDEIFQEGVRFSIPQSNAALKAKFRQLPYRDNYKMVITAQFISSTSQTTTTQTIEFNKIELMGDGVSSGSLYGLPPLNGQLTRYIDNDQVIQAGTVGIATVEIRTASNKLSKLELTDLQNDIDFHGLNVLSVKKGGLKGQYEFTFKESEVKKHSYQPTIKYVEADNQGVNQEVNTTLSAFRFSIVSNKHKKIIVARESVDNRAEKRLMPGTVDNEYVLRLRPTDEFGNTVLNLKLEDLNLGYTHESGSDVKMQLVGGGYDKDGNMVLKLTCRQSGKITFTQADNMFYMDDSTTKADKLWFNMQTGQISMNQTVSSIDSDKIKAGEYSQYYLELYDNYKNPVTLSDSRYSKQTLEMIYTQKSDPNTKIAVSSETTQESNKIQYRKQLTKSGDYQIQIVLTDSQKKTSTSFELEYTKLQVQPNDFAYQNSKLYLFSSKQGGYSNQITNKEEISVQTFPQIQPRFYDQYMNRISFKDLPEASQKDQGLRVKQYVNNGQYFEDLIYFCLNEKTQADYPTFYLCKDDQEGYPKPTPARQQWEGLVNQQYTLELTTGDKNNNYNITCSGAKNSKGTSSLQMDVQKTFVNPRGPFSITAGEQFTFSVETRDWKNVRKSQWYKEMIELKFQGDSSAATVETIQGDRRGVYQVTVTYTKAYENPALKFQLYVNKTKYEGQDFSVTVKPGKIDTVRIVDKSLNKQGFDLGTFTTDQQVMFYLSAEDKHQNHVDLEGLDDFNYKAFVTQNGKNKKVPLKKIEQLKNGAIKVQADLRYLGQHTIKLPNTEYTYRVVPGNPHVKYSYAELSTTQTTAGQSVDFNLVLKDSMGYDVENLNSKQLEQVKVWHNTHIPEQGVVFKDEAPVYTQPNKLKYSFQFTKAFEYKFSPQFNSEAIPCKKCRLTNKPGAFNLQKSKIYKKDYFKTEFYEITESFKESNADFLPTYKYVLCDQYNNELWEVPKVQVNVFIYGQGGITKNNQTEFPYYEQQTQQQDSAGAYKNTIYVNVKDSVNYKKIVAAQQPYTFEYEVLLDDVSQGSITKNAYMLGSGQTDGCFGTVDVSKTLIENSTVIGQAGQPSLFFVTVMTDKGCRKVDFNGQVSVVNSNQEIETKVVQGDQDGVFIVYVKTDKAFYEEDNQKLQLKIDSDNIQEQVKLIINPGPLCHVNMVEHEQTSSKRMLPNMQYSGSAGNDYKFELAPFDCFQNPIKTLTDQDVNIDISLPSNEIFGADDKAYTVVKNEKTGTFTYYVQTAAQGQYTIYCEHMKDNLNYLFTVNHGEPSYDNIQAYTDKQEMIAGETVRVTVDVSDKYFNPITETQAKTALKLQYKNEDGSTISLEWTGSQDGKLWTDAQITTSGLKEISVIFNNEQAVACKDCNVQVKWSNIDISKTKFVMKVDSNVVETTKDQIQQGEMKTWTSLFYDQYGNKVESFEAEDKFVVSLTGNNCDEYGIIFAAEQQATFGELTINPPTATSSSNPEIITKDHGYLWTKLVPSEDDYTITVSYTNSVKTITGSTQMTLRILGTDEGYGNGFIDIEQTYISIQRVDLIAGKSQESQDAPIYYEMGKFKKFTVEFRTNQNKRLTIEQLQTNYLQFQHDDNTKVIFRIQPTKYDNRYTVFTESTKAYLFEDNYFVTIMIQGSPLQKMKLQYVVDPDIPDPTKTILVNTTTLQPMSNTLRLRQRAIPDYITLKVYDKFSNLYRSANMSSAIQGRIIAGNATLLETKSIGQGFYTVTVVPEYPPKDLEVQLWYSIKQTTQVIKGFDEQGNPQIEEKQIQFNGPMYEDNIKYEVQTTLAPDRTLILGDTGEVRVDEEMNLMILLKDKFDMCYEKPMKVDVRIQGPYKWQNMEFNDKETRFTQMTKQSTYNTPDQTSSLSNKYCNSYYTVKFDEGSFKKIGYYQIEVYITELNQETNFNNRSVAVRTLEFLPGKIYLKQSLLYLPYSNTISNQLQYKVTAGQQFTFHLDTYDKYSNQITETRPEQLYFQIPQLQQNVTYNKWISNLNNGTYKVEVQILKVHQNYYQTSLTDTVTMHYDDLQFSFDMTYTEYLEMKQFLNVDTTLYTEQQQNKRNVPKSIYIVPGQCSTAQPQISRNHLDNVLIGVEQNFTIQCVDDYQNKLRIGGDVITANIRGYGLDVVGEAKVVNYPRDLNDGSYIVDFTLSWEGNYSTYVFLNSEPYGTQDERPFNFRGIYSLCPKNTPKQCPNKQMCVKDLRACDMDVIKCSDKQNPILCQVQGADTCVNTRNKCDCPANYTKCIADGKCIPEAFAQDLCSTLFIGKCPDRTPFKCADGFCRRSSAECSSIPGCPMGYNMCPDQSCVRDCTNSTDPTCQSQECQSFKKCDAGMYKCENQDCVSNPFQCPTRKSCNNVNHVLCPDKTCAQSELECLPPVQCPKQQLACPDQSCFKYKVDNCMWFETAEVCSKRQLDQIQEQKRQNCPQGVSCPHGSAMCENNVCAENCGTFSIQIDYKSSISQSATNTSINGVIGDNLCGREFTIVCPGGECAMTFHSCPSLNSCPSNMVQCEDGSCAMDLTSCSSQQCKSNEYKCWDGKCVTSTLDCSTRPVCPPTMPTMCADGTCVASLSQCQEPVGCPPSQPYMCAHGECRKNQAECPTLITCPLQMPIMCSDSSCRRSVEECQKASETKCQKPRAYNCPDGSCATAKSLCPQMSTCKGSEVRCLTGECKATKEQCPQVSTATEVCQDTQIRCPDGSCRKNKYECPTITICPSERPIKCDDGTCQETSEFCISSQCAEGLTRCPDGTCVLNSCGTPVTCPLDTPYKCYDNTCKVDFRDCPKHRQCKSDTPVLCADGSCVETRMDCIQMEACPSEKPIKCPDLSCQASLSDCKSIDTCPKGMVECEGGQCANTVKACPEVKCPSYAQHRCADGFCVEKAEWCDNEVTACPYNKPFRCAAGNCVTESTLCTFTFECSGLAKEQCPDGSCAFTKDLCPLVNKCPTSYPKRCADGTCVEAYKTCRIAKCPNTHPIKCLDGLCVETTSSCKKSFSLSDFDQCVDEKDSKFTIPCADGRCTKSSGECRPVLPCPEEHVRCQDGSCRNFIGMCPVLSLTCSKKKPYMCENGACAFDSYQCLNTVGCPKNQPIKCKQNGQCAKSDKECEEKASEFSLFNGCSLNFPFRCTTAGQGSKNNGCVKSLNDCQHQVECPDEKPILCADNSCAISKTKCMEQAFKCTDKQVICPDGSCRDKWAECLSIDGCPMATPYRCPDGSCKSTTRSTATEEGCQPFIECPKHTPFLCADGSCAGDATLCSVLPSCNEPFEFRCPDKSCAKKVTGDISKDCNNADLCPIVSPILCGNGFCVKSIEECTESKKVSCTGNKPFMCSTGVCGESPIDCVPKAFSVAGGMNMIITDNNTDISLPGNDIKLIDGIDFGCTLSMPFRCSDGGCKADKFNCKQIQGCNEPAYSYQCPSGSCVANKNDCEFQPSFIQSNAKCAKGTTRCNDGFCRQTCPEYNGCPMNTPLRCPIGKCANFISECAGISSCHSHQPFRCVTGECVAKPEMCSRILRTYLQDNLVVTNSPLEKQVLKFISNPLTLSSYGMLEIPPSAFYSVSTNTTSGNLNYVKLMVESIPESVYSRYEYFENDTMKEYTMKLFPLSDGILSYWQFTRSTVIKVTTDITGSYNMKPVLTLAADVLIQSAAEYDYCLGKLTKDLSWNCVPENNFVGLEGKNRFSYLIDEDGTYAMIYNPSVPLAAAEAAHCGLICQYQNIIIYSTLGLALGLVLIAWVFWRLCRYVYKYRSGKVQRGRVERQIDEIQDTHTAIAGETIRDRIEGITFINNPLFRPDKVALTDQITSLHHELKEIRNHHGELQEENQQLLTKSKILQKERSKLKTRANNLKESAKVEEVELSSDQESMDF